MNFYAAIEDSLNRWTNRPEGVWVVYVDGVRQG